MKNAKELDRCPDCQTPSHASESTEDGRCPVCAFKAHGDLEYPNEDEAHDVSKRYPGIRCASTDDEGGRVVYQDGEIVQWGE